MCSLSQVIKGRSSAQTPENGHGPVGMGVDQARHDQAAGGVDFPVGPDTGRQIVHLAHPGDVAAFYRDITRFNQRFTVHQGQNPPVFDQAVYTLQVGGG